MDGYINVYMSFDWILTEADSYIVEVAEAKALAAARMLRAGSADSSGEMPDCPPAEIEDENVRGS